MPANQDVELVRLDGSHARLESTGGGISLTLSAEPVLLFYQAPQQGLATSLGPPALALAAPPPAVAALATATFSVQGQGLTAASLRVTGPPLWTATLTPAGENKVACRVQAPEGSPAREARFYVQRLSAGKAIAEPTVPVPVMQADGPGRAP